MNILQICHKPSYPPVDGASIAMYNLYRGLSAIGNNVHVLAMNTGKQYCDINSVPEDFVKKANYSLVDIDTKVNAWKALVNLFSNQSYNIVRFYSENFSSKLNQLIETNNYDAVILESLYSTPYISLLKKKTKAFIVLRTHNAEFKIWENLRNNERNIIRKWYLNLLCTRLKKYELEALSNADLIASISAVDNMVFKQESCQTPMIYLPFGINFSDEEFNNSSPPAQEDLVLFHLGSMDWIPHQQAFKWFLEKVWDTVLYKRPTAKLFLAGSNMPDWITNGSYSNVKVINNYIDGKTFMNKKAIMIVPSFSGSGIRIKIAEGMAKGKVIITTANGAMGIPCTHNENIFISDDHDEWVNIIIKCISDLELVRKVSEKARLFSQKEFDYQSAAVKLMQSLVKYA